MDWTSDVNSSVIAPSGEGMKLREQIKGAGTAQPRLDNSMPATGTMDAQQL